MENVRPQRSSLAAIAGALLLAACAGGPPKNSCDPHTITVNGRCFWEKDRACDAIGCLPPNECVVLETTPAQVECKKQP